MLHFFRRYQKFIYIAITVVVIISFSFFGTYQALMTPGIIDPIAFRAIDGKDIKRSDVEEMALFIGSDSQDKLLYGGAWGPNFLNDGVIRKDFLETGLAEILAKHYQSMIGDDLQSRLEKERRFTPYAHPQAKFLSAEAAWKYFAPEMKSQFDALRQAQLATDPAAFSSRVQLYLMEQQFPAPALQQVLKYQEQQYNWLTHDPHLDRSDLSLFGYHSTEDWFGPRFTRLLTEFVINSAKYAEQKGYVVSKADALAELIRNAEISYHLNKKRQIGVTNARDYFNEQLRRLGMDQTKAIKIWQQVLLFRRLFQDTGNAVVTDLLPLQKMNQYANEYVQVDLYQLPKPFQFTDEATLQKFEAYINAVSRKPAENRGLLKLPTDFYTPSELAGKYPELVQKTYVLDIAQANTSNLEVKVGVKDTWNWEVEDKNWERLKKEFPELGIQTTGTREERFAALDRLDSQARARIDRFARKEIVAAHPEWIDNALAEAEAKQEKIGIRLKGGSLPIAGLDTQEKRKALIQFLDNNDAQLSKYTADNQSYYRIKVISSAPELEILTFEEARQDDALEKISDQQLKSYYIKTREIHPNKYQNEDKTWKSFTDVKETVAKEYFAPLRKAIRDEYAAHANKGIAKENKSLFETTHRFYAYLREAKEAIQKNPETSTSYYLTEKENPFNDQWRLEKKVHRIHRKGDESISNIEAAFLLQPEQWSEIETPVTGALAFFQVKGKGSDESSSLGEAVLGVHSLLSNEVQRAFAESILKLMDDKGAVSLDYMYRANGNDVETMEP